MDDHPEYENYREFAIAPEDLGALDKLIRTAANPSDLNLCQWICFHYMFFQPFCSFLCTENSRAMASIAATTDPEMFMIGGGVARAGEVLFDPLREHYKTYAFKSCRETPIVAATLGNDAGIYGSVRLIVGE